MTPLSVAPADGPPAPESLWQDGGLSVLNAGGSDPYQPFPDGAGVPASGGARAHAPVNYHAYAACTRGAFHRKATTLPPSGPVLVLLRRDLKLALKTVEALKSAKRPVAISLKESGYHQVAAMLSDARRLSQFREVCALADGVISSTPELVPFYRGAGARVVEFIPTPYPVDVSAWDFSRPLRERSGIFIGTREFSVISRQHLAALLAVKGLGAEVPVTVVNTEGRSGRRQLEALDIPRLKIMEGRLDYPAYLSMVARHRVVFQLDRSAVPGQVAGDSLLCGMPCVGGDGAIERTAFTESCGFGRSTTELQELTLRLLKDDEAWTALWSAARQRALEQLSFRAGAGRLSRFVAAL